MEAKPSVHLLQTEIHIADIPKVRISVHFHVTKTDSVL